MENDKIIAMMGENFSLRKILGEEGWNIYIKASDKVKTITELVVTNDLRKMQEGFKRLNKLSESISPPNLKRSGI